MSTPKTASAISDLGPEVYARWRASRIGATTERLERELILELVGDVGGHRILDVGCGDGELAVKLRKRGAIVVGVDASAAMIDSARARAKEQDADLTFEVAMAEHLPFAPEQFDVVMAITILCFVNEALPVLREAARVLRPGGRFIIGELGKWSIWAAERRIRAWLGSQLWRRGKFWTANELRSVTRKAGLVVKNVRGAIYYPRWSLAARLLSPCDPVLGHITTIGAGFVVLSAIKPKAEHPKY